MVQKKNLVPGRSCQRKESDWPLHSKKWVFILLISWLYTKKCCPFHLRPLKFLPSLYLPLGQILPETGSLVTTCKNNILAFFPEFLHILRVHCTVRRDGWIIRCQYIFVEVWGARHRWRPPIQVLDPA
jgi:hypothetical protein